MEFRERFSEIKVEKYYDFIKKEYLVEMRDGCKLETVAYLPTRNNLYSLELPVLLTRTPYGLMRNYQETHGEEYAKRGVAYVYQFCRGTGGSEGVFEPNVNEKNDGIDTLEWLVKEDWCGQIALHGTSYMALNCWVLADSLPERVVGMFVSHYGTDRYFSAYEAGLFRHDILTGWALSNCGVKFDSPEIFVKKYIEAANYRPHELAVQKIWDINLPWYQEWISETDYDSEYWKQGFWQMLKEMPSKLNKPVFIIAGWFDHHLKGTLLAYDSLNENIKEKSKLVVGGWNHSFKMETGEHESINGSLNLTKELFYWFTNLISGNEKGGTELKYCIGEDKWYTDFNQDKNETYYLNAVTKDGYSLTKTPSENSKIISYKYDPLNPVKSLGGETLFVSEDIRGCRLQGNVGEREDVISFVSQIFETDKIINGKIKAILKVQTDVKDTCFTVKISDVFPDGKTYNIRNNITTLSYRNGATKRKKYTPNEIVTIEIECLPILWKIKKNHKIRVDISSSNFPEYAVHSNTEGVWSKQKDTVIANQKLHIGSEDGCRIIIPIV